MFFWFLIYYEFAYNVQNIGGKNILILYILRYKIRYLFVNLLSVAQFWRSQKHFAENVEISSDVIAKLLAAGVSTSQNCYPCSYEAPGSYSAGHYQLLLQSILIWFLIIMRFLLFRTVWCCNKPGPAIWGGGLIPKGGVLARQLRCMNKWLRLKFAKIFKRKGIIKNSATGNERRHTRKLRSCLMSHSMSGDHKRSVKSL